MVSQASVQVDATVGSADQETDAETTAACGPPGGETAAEAAEPPGQRVSLWRRIRRSRLGVAALLPVLLLLAVYVASPFAGTASQPVDQPGVTTASPGSPGAGR